MIRLLFVDDDLSRHKFADDAFSDGFNVWHAYNVEQAKKLVQEKDFDIICLDHDMADDGSSGADVAYAIVNRRNTTGYQPSFVWVHTWNPSGRQRIEGILAGYVRHGSAMFSAAMAQSVAKLTRAMVKS